jgi:hypothetical protein
LGPQMRSLSSPVPKPFTLDTLDTKVQDRGTSLFLDCWADVLGALLLYLL